MIAFGLMVFFIVTGLGIGAMCLATAGAIARHSNETESLTVTDIVERVNGKR